MSGVMEVVVAFTCAVRALAELAIACCPATATAAVNIRAFIARLVCFIGLNSLLMCPTGEIEEVLTFSTAGGEPAGLASLFCTRAALFIDTELKTPAKINNRG
jgi:hypothetical protein